MSLDCTPDQRIEPLLHTFGLTADSASVRACGRGILFRFREPEHAACILSAGGIFARGRLGVLHASDVGGLAGEYRFYTNGHDCSLHIVLGKTGTVFADIDRFNPYQGPLQMLLHGVLELCPYLVRTLRQRALTCAAAATGSPRRNG